MCVRDDPKGLISFFCNENIPVCGWTNPSEKYTQVKIGSFPQGSGEQKKLKPAPSVATLPPSFRDFSWGCWIKNEILCRFLLGKPKSRKRFAQPKKNTHNLRQRTAASWTVPWTCNPQRFRGSLFWEVKWATKNTLNFHCTGCLMGDPYKGLL